MEKNTQHSLNLDVTFPVIRDLLVQEGLLTNIPYLKERVFEDLPSRYPLLTPDTFLLGATENKDYFDFITSLKSKTAQELEGVLTLRPCDETTLDDTRKAFAYFGLSVIWDIIASELGAEPNEYLIDQSSSREIYYPLQDKEVMPIVLKLATDCGDDPVLIADALFHGLELVKHFRQEKRTVTPPPPPPLAPSVTPINPEIGNKVEILLAKYDNLYQRYFIERPVGVLTSSGIVTFNKNTQTVEPLDGSSGLLNMSQMYMEDLYQKYREISPMLPETTEKRGVSSDYVDTQTGALRVTYSPYFHVMNVFGLSKNADGSYTQEPSWVRYRELLRETITKKFNEVAFKIIEAHKDSDGKLSKKGQSALLQGIQALEFLLTNAIIVDTFDTSKDLRLRDLLNDRLKPLATPYHQKTLQDAFKANTGKVMFANIDDKSLIQTIVFLFNETAYDNEILFAYKAYNNYVESGNTPDLSNIILGKDSKGDYVTTNFNSTDSVLTSLLAGSGSGKGVLTLSILAGLVANGVPFAYLDCKPDMSATLWDLERKLDKPEHPCRILSIEAQNLKSDTGQAPVRPFDFGLDDPKYKIKGVADAAHLTSTELRIIPYLKGMQLFNVLAAARTAGAPKSDRAILIMDEAQSVSTIYTTLAEKLVILKSASEAKGKNPAQDGHEYYTKMHNVLFTDLYQTTQALVSKTGRKGNVGVFMVGQKTTPELWNFKGGWANGVFGNSLKNTVVKIVGKNAGGSATYGLERIKKPSPMVEKIDDKDTRGYFAMHATGVCPENEDRVSIFKSCLILNTNDFNPVAWAAGDDTTMPITGGLLKNITNEVVRNNIIQNELLCEDGSIRAEIGFEGLLTKLLRNDTAKLAHNLSKGYYLIEDLARQAGLLDQFGSLDKYLFSCADGAFYTTDEIVDAIISKVPLGAPVEGAKKQDDPLTESHADDDFMSTAVQNKPNVTVSNTPNNPSTPSTPVQKPVAPTPPKPTYSAVVPDPEVVEADFVEDDFFEGASTEKQGDVATHQEEGDMHHEDVTPQGNKPPTPKQQTTPPTPKDLSQTIQGVYSKPLGMKSNPFQHTGEGFFGKQAALAEATKVVLQSMKEAFGGFDRITSFDITMDGIMIINKIKFVPTLPASIVESMPIDIQHGLHRGSIVDLFDLHYLTKFKNLASLVIEDPSFANSRAKREIGVYNNNWKALFNKFKHLTYLSVGGKEYGSTETYDSKKDNAKEAREGKLRKAGIFSSLSPGFMSKAWDRANANPLFKATKRTLGGVIAYNGLIGLATLFGPVALVAGAVAGGLYLKNR